MKITNILFLIILMIFSSACSKKDSETSAKFKLTLSGITNFTNGIGSGGAILFGKSSSGQQFGKILSNAEENFDLANGQWTFYAVMWNKVTGNFDSTPSCAKTSVQLNGTAISIPLNLKNTNCTDDEFSGGNHYTYIDKIKFSDFFLEECDELNKSSSYTCLAKNQGSALSYRLSFRSYQKATPASEPVFSSEVINSKCLDYQTMHDQGNKVNFPTGTSGMNFVISAEMFLGTSDCGATMPDTKGIYQYVFTKGLAAEATVNNKLVKSPANSCTFTPSTKEACDDNLGTWATSFCSSMPVTILAFTPYNPANCGGAIPYDNSYKYIKQMLSIPKDFLCRNSNYGQTGADVFPGGLGTQFRPYKICNEWQMNQIGERHSSSDNLASKHYKLMNDLDMNVTDFTPNLRPSCVGVAGSVLGNHHNFNPLSQLTRNGCAATDSTLTDFTGTFNGNKKVISHARIITESLNEVGMVRNLESNAEISDLTFRHYEVSGQSKVGGIAGHTEAWSRIARVTLEDTSIDTENDFAGGVVGVAEANSTIIEVRNVDADIYGFGSTGGLVGSNNGNIINSMFRGNIKQHQSLLIGVGGLIGNSETQSMISGSFSEGSIEASAKYVGGVAGVNKGNINSSYSNMFLRQNYANSGGRLGGIVGYHISGSISSVYSDSILFTVNATSDGIAGLIGSGTVSDCFSSSALSTSSSFCSTNPDLRGNGVAFAQAAMWKNDIPNLLPRLTWELTSLSRKCLLSSNLDSIINQRAAGKGSLLNPVVVCTAAQLKALNGSMSDLYATIGEDINLSSWVDADVISTFGGTLDGKGYSLYGLSILGSTINSGLAIFKNNTGTISHLTLLGNVIEHNFTLPTGILTGVNSGTISKVEFVGNSLKGQHYVGQVAGSNSGTIDQIYINHGSSVGWSYVGGVAGENTGTISRASAQISVMPFDTTNYLKFGGIAGSNNGNGLIDQVIFAGNMVFSSASSAANGEPFIGGLVGYNNGVVKNGMTKNYTHMTVFNNKTVGGLLGYNGSVGRLETSLGLGTLLFNGGGIVPAGATFAPTVGHAAAGSIESNVLYLQHKTGATVTSAQVTNCTGTVAVFPGNVTPLANTSATVADMMKPNNMSGATGDNLSTYQFFGTTLPSAFQVPYLAACNPGDIFNFYKSFEPNITGRRSIAQIGTIATYSNFNIGYDSGDAVTSLKLAELYDFFMAQMYERSPKLIPPVWEFQDGRGYPRLLQIND